MLMSYLAVVVIAALAPAVQGACPFINAHRYGYATCTDSINSGSVCTLGCNKYFDLAGTTDPSRTVTCGYDGEWSMETDIQCDPIKCFPEHETPEHGDLICTADNDMATVCVFYCNQDYDMQGVKDRTAFSICRDDGDGDAIGVWSNEEGIPHPPVCEIMTCEPAFSDPENGRVICSSGNKGGSLCIFHCNEGYDLVGTSAVVSNSVCKDDDDGDNRGQWTEKTAPTCRKCTQLRNTQVIALIHTENDVKKSGNAAKLISRLVTVLKRRVRMRVELRATRYYSDVSMDGEFYTTSFVSKRDKSILESLPFTGSGENIENALKHASDYLPATDSKTNVQVVLIITDSMKRNENAVALAEGLRNRGVLIICVGMNERYSEPSYTREDLAELSGSNESVFEILSPRSIEVAKDDISEKIRKNALEKGCEDA